MSKMRVLLIDDEEELVSALEERLELRGIDAEYALNGELAFQRMQEKKFDVAVIDIMMPNINGLEVLMNIKKIQPDIQAILLTGRSDKDDSRIALEHGAFDYIMKPVDINTLIKLMKKAVENVSETKQL